MTRRTILRVVSKVLIPFILLFGLYTQFHGDFGPGGGFQAGVIIAAAVILYGLIFGIERVVERLPPRAVEIAMALGALTYGGVGLVTVLLGGTYLDYDHLQADPLHGHHGQHLGILLVELGVGLTVSSVFVAIIGAFAVRGREL